MNRHWRFAFGLAALGGILIIAQGLNDLTLLGVIIGGLLNIAFKALDNNDKDDNNEGE